MFLYFLVILRKKICFLPTLFFPLGFFFICRMFLCLLPKHFLFHAFKNESFLISFILFQTKKKGTEKARGNTFQGFFSCLKQKKKSGFLRKKKRFSLAQTLFPLGFSHMQQCCLVYSVPHMENKPRNQVESFIN